MHDPHAHIQRMSLRVNTPIYGFKLLSYQLLFTHANIKEKKRFVENLYNHGFKFIYLHRENLLRYALSILYARRNMYWHAKKGQAKSLSQMIVNPEDVKELIDFGIRDTKFESDMLSSIPFAEVIYEHDLEDSSQHNVTLQRISEYLNIEYYPPSTELNKITTKRISGFVENSDELYQYFLSSPYIKYFPSIEDL